MGNGFQFLDIIFFALIAAFLVLRLRSVLGRRDGHKGPPRDPFGALRPGEADNENTDNVMQLPDRSAEPRAFEELIGDETEAKDASEEGADSADPVQSGLARIKQTDPSFDLEEFLVGARTAFEMIVRAFAGGDTETLKALLSREVFGNFAEAIRKREDEGERLETVVTAIRTSDIVEASCDGRTAHVTVKFVSDQTNTIRDSEGRIIEGDPEETSEVTDFWTFARSMRARDPNWTLVATGNLD